jgi:hypothetical protein
MDPATLALLAAAAPAVKDVVVALVKAINAGDQDSARKATEAALRLAFEARQAVPKP